MGVKIDREKLSGTGCSERHVPELLDQLDAVLEGGSYVTTQDMTLYVDGTLGSDADGDGSVGSPYATVARAYEDIPRYVRHECKILVAAGSYAGGWPTSIAPVFEAAGSLSIVGVGTPTVVSGPWTVTGVADLGLGGQQITVGAGGLGADDSLCGQFIMIATGSVVDQAHRVVANTDTTIDIVLVTNKAANADTFNLVIPAVKIPSSGCDFRYDSRTQYGSGFPGGWANCRLILHNIYLDASAATTGMDLFKFAATGEAYSGFWVDFVLIEGGGTSYGYATFVNANLNQYHPAVDAFITDGGTGIANLGASVCAGLSVVGGGDREHVDCYCRNKCELFDFAISGMVRCEDDYIGMNSSSVGSLFCLKNNRTDFLSGEIVGKAGVSACDAEGANLVIHNSYFATGATAIRARRGSYVSLDDVVCSITGITGSAMDIGALCRVRQATALPNFLGATAARAAYRFTAPAVDIDGPAWMATDGDGATDSLGAFLVRGP